MSTVRQIHKEAMVKMKLANAAKASGDFTAYQTILEDAYVLEREAAQLLTNDFESEPTRSVLFRSAASMANSIGFYSDAIELISTALKGNPHYEIREELIGLLDQVNEQVINEYPIVRHGAQSNDAIIIAVNTDSSVVDIAKDSRFEEPKVWIAFSQQSMYLLKLNEHLKKAYKSFMTSAMAEEEKVQGCIANYLQLKHKLISQVIEKPDTQAVWYSIEFLHYLYDEITYVQADGIRFYLSAYEESHLSYPMQTCLTAVPTRALLEGAFVQEDIVPEKLPDFEERMSGKPYRGKPLPPSFVSNSLMNIRIKNYLNLCRPLFSEAIGKVDTTSIWYSKVFVENLLKGLMHFNANGISICFGTIGEGDDLGRTTLIMIPTILQADGSISLSLKDGGFMAFSRAQNDITEIAIRSLEAVLELNDTAGDTL